jgi:hypothetical protein
VEGMSGPVLTTLVCRRASYFRFAPREAPGQSGKARIRGLTDKVFTFEKVGLTSVRTNRCRGSNIIALFQ